MGFNTSIQLTTERLTDVPQQMNNNAVSLTSVSIQPTLL